MTKLYLNLASTSFQIIEKTIVEGNQTSLLSEFVCSVDIGLADLDLSLFVETNFSSEIKQMDYNDAFRDIFSDNPTPLILTRFFFQTLKSMPLLQTTSLSDDEFDFT